MLSNAAEPVPVSKGVTWYPQEARLKAAVESRLVMSIDPVQPAGQTYFITFRSSALSNMSNQRLSKR